MSVGWSVCNRLMQPVGACAKCRGWRIVDQDQLADVGRGGLWNQLEAMEFIAAKSVYGDSLADGAAGEQGVEIIGIDTLAIKGDQRIAGREAGAFGRAVVEYGGEVEFVTLCLHARENLRQALSGW